MAFVTIITLPIFKASFRTASTCFCNSRRGRWNFSSVGAGLKKLKVGRFSRIQLEGQSVSSQSKRMMVCSGWKYSDWLPVLTMDSMVCLILGLSLWLEFALPAAFPVAGGKPELEPPEAGPTEPLALLLPLEV